MKNRRTKEGVCAASEDSRRILAHSTAALNESIRKVQQSLVIPAGVASQFQTCNTSYARLKVTAAVAIIAMSISAAYGGHPRYSKETAQATASASLELEALSESIKELVKGLDYSEDIGEEIVATVTGWTDKQGSTVLVGWRQILNQAKQNCQQGMASKRELAGIAEAEERIARSLCTRIRKEISFNQDFFDLADVVKHRQTQCLGYTQLLYVLGNSIGLSVESVNVAELKTGTLPIGSAHVAGIVNLTDGRIMMADLVRGGFVSMPFVIEDEFAKAGNYWELRGEGGFLGVDRKIQILDHSGLVAYIYNERAAVYNRQGRHTEALFCLNKAIEHHPNYADAYLNRGIAYRSLGRFNEAIFSYDRAIELKPDFAEAYYNRGSLYSKLNQFEQAVTDCSKSIELRPNFTQAYYSRGNAYRQLGRFDQAVSDYSTAIRFDSSFANAYGGRGLVYAQLGESEEAKKDLLKVVKLNPDLKPQIETISNRFALNINTDNLSSISDKLK